MSGDKNDKRYENSVWKRMKPKPGALYSTDLSEEVVVNKTQFQSKGGRNRLRTSLLLKREASQRGAFFCAHSNSFTPWWTRAANRSAVFLPGRRPPALRPVGGGRGAGPPAGRAVQGHPAAVVGRRRAELLHPGPRVPAERLGSLVSPRSRRFCFLLSFRGSVCGPRSLSSVLKNGDGHGER